MSAYCAQPNGRAKLLRAIKDRLDYVNSFPELYRAATRFHRELATLYSVDTIVTTNWDAYFEQECGATPFVSAEDFTFADMPGRKVFKIHGSILSYGSIVATREDYEACYDRLQTGLLGSTLKVFLATKTVVYVGFSFGDDDFNRIHDALTGEMRGLRPHSYIVTLDESPLKAYQNKGITPIRTDGTFFLARIKERLIAEGHMVDEQRFTGVDKLMAGVLKAHEDLAKVSVREYPDLVYGLSYQDGLIHCLERILALSKTGQYSNPRSALKTARAYEFGLRVEKLKQGKYHDVAYIDGYINGLIYFSSSDEVRKAIPIYYAFAKKKSISNLPQYIQILKQLKRSSTKQHKWALELSKRNRSGKDLVFHHIPFLC
jgi:hypothetical protein